MPTIVAKTTNPRRSITAAPASSSVGRSAEQRVPGRYGRTCAHAEMDRARRPHHCSPLGAIRAGSYFPL
jgi:hypothetical protein